MIYLFWILIAKFNIFAFFICIFYRKVSGVMSHRPGCRRSPYNKCNKKGLWKVNFPKTILLHLLHCSLLSRRLSLGQPKSLDFIRFLLSLRCEMLQTCYKHTTSHCSSPHLKICIKLKVISDF